VILSAAADSRWVLVLSKNDLRGRSVRSLSPKAVHWKGSCHPRRSDAPLPQLGSNGSVLKASASRVLDREAKEMKILVRSRKLILF
jgi:hypothetical protein